MTVLAIGLEHETIRAYWPAQLKCNAQFAICRFGGVHRGNIGAANIQWRQAVLQTRVIYFDHNTFRVSKRAESVYQWTT